MMFLIKHKINRIAPDLQFWGYEGGNVLAAIAGAGGFMSVYNGLKTVGEMPTQSMSVRVATTLEVFPDIVVTAGLAIVVLIAIICGNIFKTHQSHRAQSWVDGTTAIIGMWLVGAALYFGVSWITFTAVNFVSASALLRLCRTRPVYLKLGAIMLAAGGFGLAGYGFRSLQGSETAFLSALTFLTGIYVIFASLMTYQGGIFECKNYKLTMHSNPVHKSLFQPDCKIATFLDTRVDHFVSLMVNSVALPSVFWVSAKTKANNPFLTSMWTRLPWRLFTAIAAIATGTSAGILFGIANVFWAIGDVAIGALDWEDLKA